MKLLLFSDLHMSVAASEAIVRRSADVDVLVGAGDFASGRRGLSDCINILRVIEKPVVMVAGNNETPDELRIACRGWRSAHILHGNAVEVEGVRFFGLGGGVPVTPFGSWSFDLTEQAAEKLLLECPANCVLISHSPPKGAADQSSSGESLGSVAVRDIILKRSPRLVVCGHIHASGGKQAILGSTPVVNAGSVGVEWTLD